MSRKKVKTGIEIPPISHTLNKFWKITNDTGHGVFLQNYYRWFSLEATDKTVIIPDIMKPDRLPSGVTIEPWS